VDKYRQAYKDEREKRDTADYKLSVAAEQRKLLIKEVKSLQLDLDECNDANDKLCEMNEQMEVMIERLRREVERICKSDTARADGKNDATENEETVVGGGVNAISGEPVDAVASGMDGLSAVGEPQVEGEEPQGDLEEVTTKRSEDSSSIEKALEDARLLLKQSREVREQFTSEDGNEVSNESESEPSRSQSIATTTLNTTPPGKQDPAVTITPSPATDGSRRYSITNLLNVDSIAEMLPEKLKQLTGEIVSDSSHSSSSSVTPTTMNIAADAATTQTTNGSASGSGSVGVGVGGIRKTSIKLFSEIFNKDDEPSSPSPAHGNSGGSSESTHNHISPNSHTSPQHTGRDVRSEVSDDAYCRPSGVPICFRCNGTVAPSTLRASAIFRS
jgi:hypothetical protein